MYGGRRYSIIYNRNMPRSGHALRGCSLRRFCSCWLFLDYPVPVLSVAFCLFACLCTNPFFDISIFEIPCFQPVENCSLGLLLSVTFFEPVGYAPCRLRCCIRFGPLPGRASSPSLYVSIWSYLGFISCLGKAEKEEGEGRCLLVIPVFVSEP